MTQVLASIHLEYTGVQEEGGRATAVCKNLALETRSLALAVIRSLQIFWNPERTVPPKCDGPTEFYHWNLKHNWVSPVNVLMTRLCVYNPDRISARFTVPAHETHAGVGASVLPGRGQACPPLIGSAGFLDDVTLCHSVVDTRDFSDNLKFYQQRVNL